MKTANKCPHCNIRKRTRGVDGGDYECGTQINCPITAQSHFCRERVKVAKLKKQVERLKERAESAEWAVKELQKTVTTLRNPKF